VIGDRLVITDYHREGAAKIFDALRARLDHEGTLALTVAGESGSGKSEMAYCLAELLTQESWTNLILGQDDYFKLPPRSNHEKRLADIDWVGPGEVRLDLLDEHFATLKIDPDRPLTKPLVYFEEDRIGSEVLPAGRRDVVIAEGTYTTLLANADVRTFIDRDYKQTKMSRLRRARDPDVEFLEQVLEIEHREIATHRTRADVIIDPPEDET
jgi:uridine kinase